MARLASKLPPFGSLTGGVLVDGPFLCRDLKPRTLVLRLLLTAGEQVDGKEDPKYSQVVRSSLPIRVARIRRWMRCCVVVP